MTTSRTTTDATRKNYSRAGGKPIANTILNTERFVDDFHEYCRNALLSGISGLLNEKRFQLKNPNISTRQLTSWDKEDLLDIAREGKGWRRFSVMESVWVNIIFELRVFGFPVENIKTTKDSLNRGKDIVGFNMPMLEYAVYKSVLSKANFYLLIFEDGTAKVFDAEEYICFLVDSPNLNYLMIDLTQLVRACLDINRDKFQNFEKNFISEDERKLLNFMRNNQFEKLTITKSKNKMDTILSESRVNVKIPFGELKKMYPFQKIEVNVSDNKTVELKQIVKKKFKDLK
ncbi:MAG: MerR family transcriptional regulator [Bacteroidetes bacterium]|nr:MerR family transcriptional regulator [Bacteroidota bacterium]